MYVCMYVCMYVNMYVCMYVCVYVCSAQPFWLKICFLELTQAIPSKWCVGPRGPSLLRRLFNKHLHQGAIFYKCTSIRMPFIIIIAVCNCRSSAALQCSCTYHSCLLGISSQLITLPTKQTIHQDIPISQARRRVGRRQFDIRRPLL